MLCPKCGSDIPEANNFCTNCGEQIDNQTQDNSQIQQNNPLQQDAAAKGGAVAKKSNKGLIAICIVAGLIALGLVGYIVVAFVFPNNNSARSSNGIKDSERFSDVISEYNTVYKQGSVMA